MTRQRAWIGRARPALEASRGLARELAFLARRRLVERGVDHRGAQTLALELGAQPAASLRRAAQPGLDELDRCLLVVDQPGAAKANECRGDVLGREAAIGELALELEREVRAAGEEVERRGVRGGER